MHGDSPALLSPGRHLPEHVSHMGVTAQVKAQMLALGASPETSCHPTASDTPTEQIRESRLERPSNTHRAVWEVGETLGLNLALWASCSSPPTIGGVVGGSSMGQPWFLFELEATPAPPSAGSGAGEFGISATFWSPRVL
jgi:hypothetical protein